MTDEPLLYTLPLTCALLGLAVAADAQELLAGDDLFELSIEELMQVELRTGSHLAQSLAESPGLVMVINRQQIERRGYRNLRDLLKDLPATEVKRHTLTEHTTSAQMRGVPGRVANDQFVILLDGHRINEPSSAAISLDDNLPLYMVQRVEVAYGPYSSQYGADAVVGVINLISSQPKAGEKSAYVALEGGDYDYRRASGFGQARSGDFALALGGHRGQSDNDSPATQDPERYQLGDLVNFSGDTVVPAEQRAGYRYPLASSSIFAKASYADDSILGLMHSSYEAPTWGAEAPNAVDYGVDAFWQQRLTTLWFDQHWRPAGDYGYLFGLDYGLGEVYPDSSYRNRFSDFNRVYKYQRSERYQASAEVRRHGRQHDWNLGLQLQHFDVIPRTTDLPRPYDRDRAASGQGMFFPGTDDSLPIRFYDISYDNQALFGELISRWGYAFTTQAGLRYEHNSLWGESLTPRLAFTWNFAERLSLKGIYGQAYKAPAPELSLGYFGSFSGQQNGDGDYTSGFFRITNEELQPETSDSYELTLQYQPNDRLLLSSTAYYILIDDVMRPTMTVPAVNDFIDGGYIANTEQVQNLNRLISYGLSNMLLYQWQPRAGWRWELWCSYDYSDGELRDSVFATTIDLPTSHQHKFKAGGDLGLGEDWALVPSLYLVSAGNSNKSNPNDPRYGQDSPGFVTADLLLRWDGLAPGASVYLRGQNLFNRRYYEVGKVGSAYQDLAVQEGRWLQAGVSYRF